MPILGTINPNMGIVKKSTPAVDALRSVAPKKSVRAPLAVREARADYGVSGEPLRSAPSSLADALLTTTQQRVLGLLFGLPDRSFFANELITLTGSGSGGVQRELLRLESSGIVTAR